MLPSTFYLATSFVYLLTSIIVACFLHCTFYLSPPAFCLHSYFVTAIFCLALFSTLYTMHLLCFVLYNLSSSTFFILTILFNFVIIWFNFIPPTLPFSSFFQHTSFFFLQLCVCFLLFPSTSYIVPLLSILLLLPRSTFLLPTCSYNLIPCSSSILLECLVPSSFNFIYFSFDLHPFNFYHIFSSLNHLSPASYLLPFIFHLLISTSCLIFYRTVDLFFIPCSTS